MAALGDVSTEMPVAVINYSTQGGDMPTWEDIGTAIPGPSTSGSGSSGYVLFS